MTSRPLAARNAAVRGGTLYFQDYTADGYRPMVGEGRVPARQYTVRPYRPWAHLLNVRGWAFLPLAPDYTVSLVSGDLLGRAGRQLQGGR